MMRVTMHKIVLLNLLVIVCIAQAQVFSDLPGEATTQWHHPHQVRIALNSPESIDENKPTLLIIYALPNGNTIEQTMGCRLTEGMDWHFDIQHIAAQIRLLRKIDPERNYLVAYVEAEKLSWPSWRKQRPDNGAQIREIVRDIAEKAPGKPTQIALASHSGGGSFIFGFINGGDGIPDPIERIVWIDATYAYDDAEKHGDKLLAWLEESPRRHLIVMAYDDRDVKLNGKNIVSPTGGTYWRSHRMIDRLNRDVTLAESKRGPFEQFIGMNGQIHFLLHTNPEQKILHTVLVERNGWIEAMTLGTSLQNKWDGEFWGPRAYTELIAPPISPQTTSARNSSTQTAPIPDQPPNAPGGRAFCETIADLPPKAREAAIVQEITRGNIPNFLRRFCPVRVKTDRHECMYGVMPDHLAIGSDDDFVRMPMTPQSASAIAAAFGCSLPTRRMVDDIYAQAEVKLEPKPLTRQREAVRTFVQHNQIIESQRAGKPLGQLVAGIKKDVVLTNRLKEKPNRVAIYGWHKLDGKPIQSLYVGHVDHYVDYSHGIRLVKEEITVDGKTRRLSDVLKDPELAGLLSDEGPIDVEYP